MKYLLEGIESERLYFKSINHTDFTMWLNFFKDPMAFQHWNSKMEDPMIMCKDWYEKQFTRYANDLGGMNALREKKSGNLIGHAGLLVQEVDHVKELEIAYSLLAEGRNKGYATEAARKCMDVAFQNDYATTLISIISLSNTPSANVALKNGMKPVKQTIYNENAVTIFRITKEEWEQRRVQ